jgi:hypothetical protein
MKIKIFAVIAVLSFAVSVKVRLSAPAADKPQSDH